MFFLFQLLDEGIDKLGQIKKEFKDKVDFCLAANIPVPPFDVEFFNEEFPFFVGPVLITLGNLFYNTKFNTLN